MGLAMGMKTLWIDFETYNAVKDISAGTYEYARTAEILLTAWAIDDGPAQVHDHTTGEPLPEELFEAISDPETVIKAHNAMFDRNILRQCMGEFPAHAADPARWYCTMVKALSHGFPGSLDQIGQILGLGADAAKLKDGKLLINRFCKPAPKSHKLDRYTRETHPEEWTRFIEYARRDIDAMREIDRRLPDWNYRGSELALWRMDQTINDRGFAVDVELVDAGAASAASEKERMRLRCAELTGGAVSGPTQRSALQAYLNATYGLALEDTRANTLRGLDLAQLPDEAQELIEIAINANKTSTAKYAALQPALSPDGRFRGGLQYAGAARTRRWAGRTFQPHNLPSRGLPDQQDIERYIDALKAGAADIVFPERELMLYGSAALRGALIAPEGKKLVVADLSNIEGRINAWLAGEAWKLDAFRAYDAGEGPDLYLLAAGGILGKKPEDVTKAERNSYGKVSELALGYAGGVGAFQTFARAYGLKMADQMDAIQANMGAYYGQAIENWEAWGKDRAEASDTPQDEWLASETVKLAWRATNPMIAGLWKKCEDAARNAITNPGKQFPAGDKLRFKAVEHAGHNYLLCRLPSGNLLCYFHPVLEDGQLSYMALDGLTRQWRRQAAYGGLIVENACQATARDVLAASFPVIDNAGFDILLTVHDEIICEAPDRADYTAKQLEDFMTAGSNWTEGLPLAAEGFEGYRYRK